jgi:hypothetical protein
MTATPNHAATLNQIAAPTHDERPPPLHIKATWASGAFGVAILMNGISALALFYFVTVVQIPASVAGFLVFLSKLYDAVSDPLTGYLSDKTGGYWPPCTCSRPCCSIRRGIRCSTCPTWPCPPK